MPRCGSEKLKPLWGFDGCSRARWRQAVDESLDAMAARGDVDEARPAAGMTRKPSKHGLAA
jgi:hypothetical protein